MEHTNRYIEELLEKFFDGLTSIEEEKTLYNFFNTGEQLPPHLEKCRSLFHYLESDMTEELKLIFDEKDEAMVGTVEHSRWNTLLIRTWVIGVSTVAASLFLYFAVQPFWQTEKFNVYEGSYVKRNGIVSYDEEDVEAEYIRLNALVEKQIACANQPFVEAQRETEIRYCQLQKPFTDAKLQIAEYKEIIESVTYIMEEYEK